MKRFFLGRWIKGWSLPQAGLTAVVFLQSVEVLAAEPVVFRPAYAPASVDNPLKGFVPYAGQGQKFPHSLEFNYLSLASLMTGPRNFNWAPMERLLDGIATPVVLRYPAGDNHSAHAPNARRSFGYHDDSFAWGTLETGRKNEDWFYLAALREAGLAALDRWKTAPIGGEIRPELWSCLWTTKGCTKGQDFAQCVRETHASWLMDSSTSRPLAPDERERALTAARSLGYELQVVQATTALTGCRLEVSVTITNRGVAPFYAGWPVRLMAVSSAGSELVAELPFALNTLLPAATDTRSVTLDLTKVSTGEVTLLLGIPNPLKGGRPLRFANADAEPHRAGWLTLGKIVSP